LNPFGDSRHVRCTVSLGVPEYGFPRDLKNDKYIETIEELVAERKDSILKTRRKEGFGFLGENNLRLQKAGAKPRHTKTSKRESYNPLVLSLCDETRQKIFKLYLDIAELYKVASYKFRNRIKGYSFPQNTYMPHCYIT
jgi:hypothetical protein